jgi:hypothetical protein
LRRANVRTERDFEGVDELGGRNERVLPRECQCLAGCPETVAYEIRHVYVAGPITSPDPVAMLENIRAGIAAGKWLMLAGYAPFCPHLDYSYLLVSGPGDAPVSVDVLQSVSTAWLRLCDEVVLLPGWENSAGCRAEVAEASLVGIPARTFAEFRLEHEYGDGGEK